MALPKSIRDQLKKHTPDDYSNALQKDGWTRDVKRGAVRIFYKDFVVEDKDGKKTTKRRRVSIHYHPKKTYGTKLTEYLVASIGWSEEDMKRLKLIKK